MIASRASIGEEPSNIKRLHGQRSVAACEQLALLVAGNLQEASRDLSYFCASIVRPSVAGAFILRKDQQNPDLAKDHENAFDPD